MVILSERKINPDSLLSPHHIVIETKDKLQIHQTGGKK